MKLVRAEDDKMVFGVCGGLARYFDIDSSLLRIIFAIFTILGIGSPILIYLVMAAILPRDYYY